MEKVKIIILISQIIELLIHILNFDFYFQIKL